MTYHGIFVASVVLLLACSTERASRVVGVPSVVVLIETMLV